MKKRYYLALLLALSIVSVSCERPPKHAPNLSRLLDTCYEEYYHNGASDCLKNLSEKLIGLSDSTDSSAYVGMGYVLLNKYYCLLGKFDTAIYYLNIADSAFKKEKLPEKQLIIAKEMGRTYKEMGWYASALSELIAADTLLQKLNNNNRIFFKKERNENRVYYNMSESYLNSDDANNYDGAEKYANVAFSAACKDTPNKDTTDIDRYGCARALIAKGAVAYYVKHLPDSSDTLFKTCIKYCRSNTLQTPLVAAYINYGKELNERKLWAAALDTLDAALKVAESINYYDAELKINKILFDVFLDSMHKHIDTQTVMQLHKCDYAFKTLERQIGYNKGIAAALDHLVRKDMTAQKDKEEAEWEEEVKKYFHAHNFYLIALIILIAAQFVYSYFLKNCCITLARKIGFITYVSKKKRLRQLIKCLKLLIKALIVAYILFCAELIGMLIHHLIGNNEQLTSAADELDRTLWVLFGLAILVEVIIEWMKNPMEAKEICCKVWNFICKVWNSI